MTQTQCAPLLTGAFVNAKKVSIVQGGGEVRGGGVEVVGGGGGGFVVVVVL